MTVILNSGQLRHPIVFQKKRREGDGGGGWKDVWDNHSPDRVRILPVSAAQRIRGDRVESQVDLLVEGRYRKDITDDMQLIYQSRTMKIEWIINVEEANVKNQYGCTEVK